MMIDLGKYISEVQTELDRAVADVYRLEGALAILRKMQAENPQENEADKGAGE